MTYRDVQVALKARGYRLGASGPARDGVDGAWGRLSIAALRAFQADHGLPATGGADRATLAMLLPADAAGLSPPWFAEAARHLGLRETPGPADNPTILAWAQGFAGWVRGFYTADALPWCGLFVGHVVATTLPAEPLPSNPLSALAWARFGRPLPEPALGAVLVFKRPGGGHVGFYAGERSDAFRVLGGNQADSVSETWIAKGRCVATRWPLTASPPEGGPVRLTGSGPLSTHEA